MAETDVWVEMIEETRQALAELREEDLESLALRAERAFEIAEDAGQSRGPREAMQSGDPVNAGIRSAESLRELAARHRMLGEGASRHRGVAVRGGEAGQGLSRPRQVGEDQAQRAGGD